jgi:hypothetical protein
VGQRRYDQNRQQQQEIQHFFYGPSQSSVLRCKGISTIEYRTPTEIASP